MKVDMDADFKISVIIPVYNGIKYLKHAVNSVIKQTLLPCELIIIDDGSTDASIDSISDLSADFPIRIYSQKNAGQSAARNYGASLATGDYLAFLDQDDLWYPLHLEKLAQPFADNWRLGWSYSNLDEIDEHGRLIQIGRLDFTPAVHPKKSLLEMLRQDMHILPSASLILKQAFQEVGGFDVRLCGYEDDDLFMRLFVNGWKNIYLQEPLSQWRIYATSTSYSERMDVSRLIYAKKLVEQYPDAPYLNRVWAREFILPRFIHITLYLYIICCLRRKDFVACEKQLAYLNQYIAMLPPGWSQKRWKVIAAFLNSPMLSYWVWGKIIFSLPKSWRTLIKESLN